MTLYNRIFNNLMSQHDAETKIFFSRGGTEYTYSQALTLIERYNFFLKSSGILAGDIVAIESEKNFEVYCLIICCVLSGVTYIPFSTAQNINRTKECFSNIGTRQIFVYNKSTKNKIDSTNIPVSILLEINCKRAKLNTLSIPDSNIAYIMFSSGTTGKPKIIPVTRENLSSYIDSIESLFSFEPYSGFSQLADLTFDLSVHDIYLCFANNGFLCPIKSNEIIFAYRFVNELNIKYWMSVPSAVSYLFQLVKNVPEIPSLECTFFLGEALSYDTVRKWSDVTPNSKIINLYGPTECTVAASYFEININDLVNEQKNIVPLGVALKNSKLLLNDNSELLLGGTQLFPGYIGEFKELNEKKFITKDNEKYYATGDLAEISNGNYLFKGRIDFQVKIRGYRIEIEELEAILSKNLTGSFCVIPVKEIQLGNYEALSILYSGDFDVEDVQFICKHFFPSYIAIEKILNTNYVPLNSNGKLDRKIARELIKNA